MESSRELGRSHWNSLDIVGARGNLWYLLWESGGIYRGKSPGRSRGQSHGGKFRGTSRDARTREDEGTHETPGGPPVTRGNTRELTWPRSPMGSPTGFRGIPWHPMVHPRDPTGSHGILWELPRDPTEDHNNVRIAQQYEMHTCRRSRCIGGLGASPCPLPKQPSSRLSYNIGCLVWPMLQSSLFYFLVFDIFSSFPLFKSQIYTFIY